MIPAIAHFWHLRQSQGREADLERDEILKGLSSLNFHDKQRDVFEKHHPGTGQWLLKTDEFQQWFNSEQNSILWCPGIRTSVPRRSPNLSISMHSLTCEQAGAGKTVMT